MNKNLEIIIRVNDKSEVSQDEIIFSKTVNQAIEVEDIGLKHSEQLQILREIQSTFIGRQINDHMPYNNNAVCPKCGSKVCKNGTQKSDFYDALNDIKISLQKFECTNESCPWNYNPSIFKIFGTQLSPELIKLQAKFGCQMSFRKVKDTLNNISGKKRAINNHVRVAKNTYKVGQDIIAYNAQYYTSNFDQKGHESRQENYKGNTYTYNNEMIFVVDGGHVHDANNIGHNFEIMVSKIYRPENVAKVSKDRYKITQMNCSGSAKKDSQKEMIARTKEAAKAEGMNKNSKVTVLADGAKNCWNIAKSLSKMCAFMIVILDWFHIAKHFQNILNITNLADQKILDEAKDYIWNGDYENGVKALKLLHDSTYEANLKKKILSLITYLDNNRCYLTNYAERHKNGLPYSSSVAESTVEQVINSRFKKKSKARWYRINSDMLLQVRLSIINGTFDDYWDKRYSAYIPAA